MVLAFKYIDPIKLETIEWKNWFQIDECSQEKSLYTAILLAIAAMLATISQK
jgi:hypothetical protein